jgi:ribonucleotide monophosphatase NagD (HAD superfamily)
MTTLLRHPSSLRSLCGSLLRHHGSIRHNSSSARLRCMASMPDEEFRAWFSGIDHFLFDCDGVIWNGDRGLIPGARELLCQLRRHGRRFFFMTNSAAATRRGYAEKFEKLMAQEGGGGGGGGGEVLLDPPVQASEIMCTAYATALRLQRTVGRERPAAKDVYVIGTAGLAEEIAAAGFTPHGLEDGASQPGGQWTGQLSSQDMLPAERVAAVVIGIDRDVSYTKMTKAVVYLRRGGDGNGSGSSWHPTAWSWRAWPTRRAATWTKSWASPPRQ